MQGLGKARLDLFALKIVKVNTQFSCFFMFGTSHDRFLFFQQILRVLHKTYVNLKRKPVWNDLNPKAVDRDELFGFIHHTTREWKDGKELVLNEKNNNI